MLCGEKLDEFGKQHCVRDSGVFTPQLSVQLAARMNVKGYILTFLVAGPIILFQQLSSYNTLLVTCLDT